MAYRRSLATRAKFFAQQRFNPSIFYLNNHEDRKNSHFNGKLSSFLQSRSYGGVVGNNSTSLDFRDPRWSQFRHVSMTASGFLLARSMSTTKIAEKIDILTNQTMEAVSTQTAPVLSEVAIAAADSCLPVAALQYAIDGIHVFTGLNWWASIVITTLVIRTLLISFSYNQLKVTTKFKRMCEVEGNAQKRSIFSSRGFWITSLLSECLIRFYVLVSTILAIKNMVDKVPSFKTGGASWFLDLTTSDTFCILPCLNAYLFWMTIEELTPSQFLYVIPQFTRQDVMGGKFADAGLKNFTMVFSALSIPVFAFLPKALLFHFIASNLFTLISVIITNDPTVRQILKLPPLPPSPTNPTSL